MPDQRASHRQPAVQASSETWSLIDKPERSIAETREMIRLSDVFYHHQCCAKPNMADGKM